MHLLGVMVIPAGIMYGLKGPILATSDLRGTKVWALPGMPAKLMDALKAGVVATPAAKMSEIVSGGTVDAFVGIPDMYADAFKVIRYAKSATTVPGGISTSCFSFVVNKQKWQSLEPRDRDIITRLSGEALANRMAAFDQAEAAAHRAAVQAGLNYQVAPDAFVADLRKQSEALENDWLANAKNLKVDGPAALQFYRTQSAVAAK